jgi:hypothetical protein
MWNGGAGNENAQINEKKEKYESKRTRGHP